MAYKATGKLHKIFDTEQKTASFQAREFVIETTEGQYPQMVKFQLTQDKCAIVDDYNEGEMIEVDFDLRGREWNDKYFTNLNAWRISRTDGKAAPAVDPGSAESQGAAMADNGPDFDDDIPF
ncbi:MAG: DUF3127 domain-containing protein [Gammaproteobacteria bacterium]|nr:DUF3127 domain-containing protein [Gammaproteobacteria bacterium]